MHEFNSPELRTRLPVQRGYSLVELMITIAIISILTGIAIPLYDRYVREGHLTSMRMTMNGIRTPIEDFRLESGGYGATGSLVGVTAIDNRFNWEPSGDSSAYTYTVAVTGTNSYDVWGVFNANAAVWARCDNRFSNCCDPDTAGATAVTNACP